MAVTSCSGRFRGHAGTALLFRDRFCDRNAIWRLWTAFEPLYGYIESLFEQPFDIRFWKFLDIRHSQAAKLIAAASEQTLWIVKLYAPHKSEYHAARSDRDRAKYVAHPIRL